MARLLIVHHTPSPATAELLDAAVTGARDPEITGVEVVRRAALSAGAADVLAADAVLLGTPANIGYMSGALKHFFDVVYYPVLDDTRGLPYGLYVHGNLDTGRRDHGRRDDRGRPGLAAGGAAGRGARPPGRRGPRGLRRARRHPRRHGDARLSGACGANDSALTRSWPEGPG